MLHTPQVVAGANSQQLWAGMFQNGSEHVSGRLRTLLSCSEAVRGRIFGAAVLASQRLFRCAPAVVSCACCGLAVDVGCVRQQREGFVAAAC